MKNIPDLTYENMKLAFEESREMEITPDGLDFKFQNFEEWQKQFIED